MERADERGTRRFPGASAPPLRCFVTNEPQAGRGERTALVALAHRRGVMSNFIAADGHRAVASTATLMGVLGALGTPMSSLREAPELLVALEEDYAVIEPVLVQRSDATTFHVVVLPRGLSPRNVAVHLRREDGEVRSTSLDAVSRLLSSARYRHDDERLRYGLRLSAEFALPVGYHHLELHGPGIAASSLVIVAPARCPAPTRAWGAFAPLHAARDARDWGVGSFSSLEDIGAWIGGFGGGFVSTLPLNATFLEGPMFDLSPYRPVSRLAWNELFIDVERVDEFRESLEAQSLVASPEFQATLARLRQQRYADPAASLAVKRRVLEILVGELYSRQSSRLEELQRFLLERPEIAAYARFRALSDHRGTSWRTWGDASQAVLGTIDRTDRGYRYHCYVQWIAERQLDAARRGVGLYLDLPVGVHPDGFDPFWYRSTFAEGVAVGASPDIFQPRGQNWSVSPLHPQGLRAQHYDYLIAYLRHAMRYASAIRIDHVMGLHRLWWIPEGMAPSEGAYVRYQPKELRAILVLEASRAGVAVVGEDLGTVAASVRSGMRRDQMLGCHVHQFTASPNDPLPTPPENAVASLGTHDLPTFAAWWDGLDIKERAERGDLGGEQAENALEHRRQIRVATTAHSSGDGRTESMLAVLLLHLARGPAKMVLVDLEDLWLEKEPQNRPGTGQEELNFRRRWAQLLPESSRSAMTVIAELLDAIDAERRGIEVARRGRAQLQTTVPS